MTEDPAIAHDREELCGRNSISTTTTKLKINFKHGQPDVGLTINTRFQREGSWVKDQLHAPGLTNGIMLTWVTTLMNHYTRVLVQSGTFGSRPWTKVEECLDDPQYFLFSGF